MKFPVRQRPPVDLPGLLGTARVERRARILLPRLRPGDIAVLDQPDMDRATAQGLVDAGVVAVVNAAPMSSGRYPNLGPELLSGAGVVMLDGIGAAGIRAIADGSRVRLHDADVYVGEDRVATGRSVDARLVGAEMAASRLGLVTQLESFTRNSTEFLRREQDLLLHGRGVPKPATRIAGRAVVVVVGGHEYEAELRGIRPFLREQEPVIIAVGRAADVLHRAGHRPDIIVLDGPAENGEMPAAATLKAARDVVLRVEPGGGRGDMDSLERIGVRPHRFESSATSEDAALILAEAGDPSVIIGVGMHATLEEFLDQKRSGLASTYLTRLKVGPRLVDASAVPYLYSGRVRPRHLLLVMLAGLIALTAAIGVTPVGQEWAADLAAQLSDLTDALLIHGQGLLQ